MIPENIFPALAKPYFLSLLIGIFFLFSSAASAHPGKTDYQDGHKCLKNCEDWDLYYDEYHLHDQDRNAIRSETRRKAIKEPAAERGSVSQVPIQETPSMPVSPSPEPQADVIPKNAPQRVVDQGYSMPVEAGFVLTFYDSMLLGVAGLLLLAMLVLRRRKEKK